MRAVGRIQDVNLDSENNRIRVDVSVSPTRFHENIVFRTPGSTAWFVPEEGDVVEVEKLDSGSYVASTPSTPSRRVPDFLTEGDIAFQLNDSTVLHFKNTDSGYDVRLECDGDMYLDATDIFVGDENNATKVATADHTHDYTWTDAAGSGTTDPENEAPTDTNIE